MLQAAAWGFVAGSAAIMGALIGYYRTPGRHIVGVIMGFGAGVLVSVLAIDLMEEAFRMASEHGGVPMGLKAVCGGFAVGAVTFLAGDHLIDTLGGKHRKCSQGRQSECSPFGMWVGALLDGIPESVAIGVSMLAGRGVSIAVLAAVFLSNFPEGLSGSAGMKKAGIAKIEVLGLWVMIAVVTAVSSLIGYSVLHGMSPVVLATTLAVAAGAILAMLADTMMPEAFHLSGNVVALATTIGFLSAFLITKLF